MAHRGARLDDLARVQQDIQAMLQSSSDVVKELSSYQPNTELAQIKSKDFLSALKKVHANLSQHIAYLNQVSSGVAHNSSIYGLEKVLCHKLTGFCGPYLGWMCRRGIAAMVLEGSPSVQDYELSVQEFDVVLAKVTALLGQSHLPQQHIGH